MLIPNTPPPPAAIKHWRGRPWKQDGTLCRISLFQAGDPGALSGLRPPEHTRKFGAAKVREVEKKRESAITSGVELNATRKVEHSQSPFFREKVRVFLLLFEAIVEEFRSLCWLFHGEIQGEVVMV